MATLNIKIDLSKDTKQDIETAIKLLQQLLESTESIKSDKHNTSGFDLGNVAGFFEQEDNNNKKEKDNKEELEIIEF